MNNQVANVPTVTVLVPTYNRASYLRETIDSIFKQDYNDYEIVVVDNCSTDNTQQVVASYSDSRLLYYCNDANLGIIGNYNRGLSLARGKYLYLLSDDDVMSDERNIRLKVEVLDANPEISLVYSDFKTINSAGEVIGGNWADFHPSWPIISTTQLMPGKQVFEILYTQWNFICMHTVLVRHETLIKNNIQFSNQLRYTLDWALWLHLALITDFYYINEPLVSYRVHSNNTTKVITMENYAVEILSIKSGLASLYFDKHPSILKDLKEIDKSIRIQMNWPVTWLDKQIRRAKWQFVKLNRFYLKVKER